MRSSRTPRLVIAALALLPGAVGLADLAGVLSVEPAPVRTVSQALAPAAPVAAPVAEPTPVRAAPAAEPASRTRTTTTRAVAKPAKPAAPVTKPAVKPAAKPAVTPVTKPAARPVAAPSSAAPKPAATTTRVATGRDDYPWRTSTTNALDDWGFTQRQCVSFVAFRLSQSGRAIDNRSEGWGSALTWDDVARQRGRTVSATPVVGAVAHWNAGESSSYYGNGSTKPNGRYTAGSYGHVGWVTHVFADGSVQVEAYNGSGDRSWSSMRVTAPRFLRL